MFRSSRRVFSVITGVSLATGVIVASVAAGGLLSPYSTLQSPSPTPAIVSDGSSYAHIESFSETAKVVASDAAALDHLGASVAISGDTAVVGAPGDDNNKGAAYVFVRMNDAWLQQQKITGSDSVADDHFGWSVAISGETIVIGACDLNENDQGAAYVFTRSGLIWNQQQKLVAADGSVTDQFGSSVSTDGDTIAVGAFGNNTFRGAAYVYTRIGTAWSQQQKLVASDGSANDDFGWAVSVSGETTVVGAPRDDNSRGAVYVFRRLGASWSQEAKLTSVDGSEYDQLGYSVAADGDNLITGAPLNDGGSSLAGSAYVFARNGSTWTQQQKLVAADPGENDKFGGSVSIRGGRAAVGSNGDDIGSTPDRGSVYVFTLSGGAWSQEQKLTGSDSLAGDSFGAAAAVGDGVIIAGSYLDDSSSLSDSGSAYFFTQALPPPPTPTPTATPTLTPTPTPAPSPSPTASPSPTPVPPTASVSGRVYGPDGRAVRLARVIITDVESGTNQTLTTATFGYYEFSGLATGRSYVITVLSKRSRFSSRSFTLQASLTDQDFFGQE